MRRGSRGRREAFAGWRRGCRGEGGGGWGVGRARGRRRGRPATASGAAGRCGMYTLPWPLWGAASARLRCRRRRCCRRHIGVGGRRGGPGRLVRGTLPSRRPYDVGMYIRRAPPCAPPHHSSLTFPPNRPSRRGRVATMQSLVARPTSRRRGRRRRRRPAAPTEWGFGGFKGWGGRGPGALTTPRHCHWTEWLCGLRSDCVCAGGYAVGGLPPTGAGGTGAKCRRASQSRWAREWQNGVETERRKGEGEGGASRGCKRRAETGVEKRGGGKRTEKRRGGTGTDKGTGVARGTWGGRPSDGRAVRAPPLPARVGRGGGQRRRRPRRRQ